MASQCREQARGVYYGRVFEAKKEIPAKGEAVDKRTYAFVILLELTLITLALPLLGQQAAGDSAATVKIPPLIKFNGTIAHSQGIVGATFALYRDQTGGAPLWLETQNITVDEKGQYFVYLGANHAQGLPVDLFSSGEARWLGVQPEGQAEQERILLFSVPYALAAGDAQSFGGKPLSSFVLAGNTTGTGNDGLNYLNTKTTRLCSSATDATINPNGLLTSEIEFPTSLNGVTFSLKSFIAGNNYPWQGKNETSQWSYNMSPTLYVPQSLTEPMIWFGLESNYANAAYQNAPTTEMYMRYMPIGATTGYLEPFFSNVNRTTNKILETNIRAETITLTNTDNVQYATIAPTGTNLYKSLTLQDSYLYLGKAQGINRVKSFQSIQSHSPYDALAVISRGETLGWRGTIDLDVSYSAGAVVTGLSVQANSDGSTASVLLPALSGTGNAYACLDANGKLYRSQTPCN